MRDRTDEENELAEEERAEGAARDWLATPPQQFDLERWAEWVTEGVWDVPAIETRDEFKESLRRGLSVHGPQSDLVEEFE